MLEQKIEDLTRAVEALTELIRSNGMIREASLPVTPPAPAAPITVAPDALVQEKPISEPQKADAAFDMQVLKDVTLAKSRAGHQSAIRDKLSDMGVKKLQDLASDQAVEFFAWVSALGDN